MRSFLCLVTFVISTHQLPCAFPASPFRITVVDRETGRGIPLVTLRTVHNVSYITDSAGVVAFDEPGLVPGTVYFHVSSPGYEYRADGFGFRGVRPNVMAGGSTEVSMDRLNIAERLYRVTGAGIYRDSVLLGDELPLPEPVLNSQVLGSDSVQSALYRGRIYWFWGDTNRPSYPLGNFHVPGAVSHLPQDGGLPPETGVALDYFVGEDGFALPTAQVPGEGPTWIDGLTVVRDSDGSERMFAAYAKIKPPLTVYERGLVEFNDHTQQFDRIVTFPPDARLYPAGHSVLVEEDGISWVYFANPYPYIRVRATPAALQDLSQYETWTWLTSESTRDSLRPDFEASGRLKSAWRRGGLPVTPEDESDVQSIRRQSDEDCLFCMRDRQTGRRVQAHRGSVAWNDYRQKWIMIFTEVEGAASYLGEVWFAESESLTGPWTAATHIATHPDYSFYNPRHHPFLDQDGGRLIYFEGTYTATFSGNRHPTPRYDYNQLMYRLDLSDSRLPPR